jgi:Enoyl-(Acyl carrier protein) reductase
MRVEERQLAGVVRQRGRGSIINIASIAGMRSMPMHAYAPAKAAVIAITECLAAEWGRSGVRVNAVSPGYTLTPALQAAIDKGQRDVSMLNENSALGRMVSPEEVARAVCFLASEDDLAGAVRPDDGRERARRKLERDILDCGDAAKGLRQSLDRKHAPSPARWTQPAVSVPRRRDQPAAVHRQVGAGDGGSTRTRP